MGASAMVMIIVFMHVSVAEGAMWAHGGRSRSTRRGRIYALAPATAKRKRSAGPIL
jgi:hypothetical protein